MEHVNNLIEGQGGSGLAAPQSTIARRESTTGESGKKKKSRGGAVVGVAYHLPTVEQTVRHELPRADGSGAGHRGKVIPQCTLERGGSQEKPNG